MKKSRANTAPDRKGKDENVNPATRLVQLVTEAQARLFHTANYEAFATIYVRDHFETWRVKDTHFKRWISGLYYAKERKAPSDAHLAAALNVLEGQALHEGSEQAVHVRVAEHETRIYIDLANDRWESVEITASGWRVTSDCPVKFRRTPGMQALPTPVTGGSLGEIRQFVNVGTEELFVLVLGWLVGALRPAGPYPVLVIEGNQGSAKTTTSRLLRVLVDPNTAPLRSIPKNERDLMIAADNGWCQAFDNVSEVPPWMSDCFCRLSTGGGFSIRRNYTDDEEKLFNAMRPLMLNGISVGIERADLLDRSLIIRLDEIQDEKRMPEKRFWAEVENVKPRILGALLDAVSCALRRLPEIWIEKPPRMADFAYWVTAADPALGCPEGAFLRAYKANREDANELALESSLLVPFLKAIAERGGWSGTASELLTLLNKENGVDRRQQGWPKTPAALSGQLRRLLPSLNSTGIIVQMQKTAGTNSRKIISIGKAGAEQSVHATQNQNASTASLASHSSPTLPV
jgi:hypothetical protein